MWTGRERGGWLLFTLCLTACGNASAPAGVRDAQVGTKDDARASTNDGGPRTVDASHDADDALHDASNALHDAGAPSAEGGDASRDARTPSAEAGDAGRPSFDENGPVAFTMTSAMVANGADNFTEVIYLPSSPGTHPVVSLTPGLQQPEAAYAPYAERLASYGIVVLMRDDPGLLVQSQVIAADLEYVIATWLPALELRSVEPSLRGGGPHEARSHWPLAWRASFAARGRERARPCGRLVRDRPRRSGDHRRLHREHRARRHEPREHRRSDDVPGRTGRHLLHPREHQLPGSSTQQRPPLSVVITAVNASHTEFEVASACVDCAVCVPMGTANQQVVLDYAVRYLHRVLRT